jgi:hypothetical protein
MADEPSKQDWAVLDLKPGARPAQVQRAYQRRRALYERDTLATYTLLTEDERSQMLERIDLAYRRIMGQSPAQAATWPPAFPERKVEMQRPIAGPPPGARRPEPPPPARPVTPTPDRPQQETAKRVAAAPPPEAPPARVLLPPRAAGAEPEPEGPEPDPVREPGAYLRYHRQRRRVSIEAVADETKISTMQLEKLETESYFGLPAAVYIRGFIIQYARFLDLPDPERLANLYLAHMRAGTHREPRDSGQ